MWRTVRFVAALVFAWPLAPHVLAAVSRIDWPLVGSHLLAAVAGGPLMLSLAWRVWRAVVRRIL